MITEEQLAEWEREPWVEGLSSEAIPALVAEVRRLQAASRDCPACERLASTAAKRDMAIIALAKAEEERDAMRAVVEAVRDGLDKIADGACDPPMTSYGTGCSGRCKYIAEAALAKLDEASKGEVMP
jgi:hypothetical protein